MPKDDLCNIRFPPGEADTVEEKVQKSLEIQEKESPPTQRKTKKLPIESNEIYQRRREDPKEDQEPEKKPQPSTFPPIWLLIIATLACGIVFFGIIVVAFIMFIWMKHRGLPRK